MKWLENRSCSEFLQSVNLISKPTQHSGAHSGRGAGVPRPGAMV